MPSKKKISEDRDASDMDEDGLQDMTLITEEQLEEWGVRSIAEANAAIRAGKIRWPVQIRGYTLIPFKRR